MSTIPKHVTTDNTPIRGYCCLVAKPHAIELHDLSEEDAQAFIRDIRRVSQALLDVTDAVKLNYDIHGNTIPHLHMHFFPRYVGDAFEDSPIDPTAKVPNPYTPGEFREFVRELRKELQTRTTG